MKRILLCWIVFLSCLIFAGHIRAGENFYIWQEGEEFQDKGGWQIEKTAAGKYSGSAYLYAGYPATSFHAATEVEIPQSGNYILWVYSWGCLGHSRQYAIEINGKRNTKLLGDNGDGFYWEKGDTFKLEKGKVTIKLIGDVAKRGRCDVILLTTDTNYKPKGITKPSGSIQPGSAQQSKVSPSVLLKKKEYGLMLKTPLHLEL